MSNVEADIRRLAREETDQDERSLRDRILDNPRPALVWLAGALLLVALEFSRIIAGILKLGEAVYFILSGVVGGPGWVNENVAGTLGTAPGLVAGALTALGMIILAAATLEWIFPWNVTDRYEIDVSRRMLLWIERGALAGILGVIAVILAITPLGSTLFAMGNAVVTHIETLAALPSVTSPQTIPNLGHRTPEGGWSGTFLGLSPAWAWGIRIAVVIVIAGATLVWSWIGYNIYREHYRRAEWTPRDDTVRRFRNHYWGLFGLVVVIGFVVLAAWAPAISPIPVEHNVYHPYSHEFQYLNDEGEVTSIAHGTANLQTQSNGQNVVPPFTYDQYDRWAPLGTTPRGQDMVTHLAYGARTSLIIGITAIGLGALIAIVLSLLSAYYKGIVDIATILASDTIISIPALLLIMLLVIIFREGDHFLAEPLDGGLLLALIFAFAYWPGMWRAIRGPSLQVAEQEWVDAAKSYGQRPTTTMRKHMAPFIAGYIMIYASLLLGGVIIFTAALTFLGLGISPPTPEWGRLIDSGQQFVATRSWHVATVSGLMIVIVVTAFNALGDGIRDAIDPEASVGRSEGGAAAAGGGGG